MHFLRDVDSYILCRIYYAVRISALFERGAFQREYFLSDIYTQSCQKCKWDFCLVFGDIESHCQSNLYRKQGCFQHFFLEENSRWSGLPLHELYKKRFWETSRYLLFRKTLYTRTTIFALYCIYFSSLFIKDNKELLHLLKFGCLWGLKGTYE